MFENLVGAKNEKGFSASVIPGETIKQVAGSATSEDTTSGSTTMVDSNAVVDRSVKFSITRDDAGCKYAFENDQSVSNAIERKAGIINNGFVVSIPLIYENNTRAKKAQEFINTRIKQLKLQTRLTSMITNRTTYGFSVTKKITNKKKDIIGLVDLSSDECRPIRDLNTGELGGKIGIGMDTTAPKKSIAMIQAGHSVIYGPHGDPAYERKYFYFSKDDIIAIGNDDRGMFKGVSRVMRALRYVEIKKTLENTVDLLARRFGPQVWIEVGNENTNLTNADIPQSYLRDVDGNPIDPATARKNYKIDAMSALNTNIQQWVDGDSLVQLAEYGIKPTVINPSSKAFDYKGYIELMSDFIKITILGLDIPGRTDVTSGIMQSNLTRDVRDMAIAERDLYIDVLNLEFVKPILIANGFKEDMVKLEFKQLDITDAEKDALIEKIKSEAIYNYMKGGWTDIPEYLKVLWNITKEDIEKIVTQQEMDEGVKDDEENDNDDGDEEPSKNNDSKKEEKKKLVEKSPIVKRRQDDTRRGR